MDSHQLPWEVIERVIDHSGGHPNTLRSLSLTCSQLRPRSRCLMFSRVDLRSRNAVFEFLDFLQDNPILKSFVRSIVVQPDDLAPFPLLHILSNLSEITFTARHPHAKQAVPALHQSSLTCFHRFGTHIQTLCISYLLFPTYLPFARILLAFPNVIHLTCTAVEIETAGDRAPLEVIRQRLCKQMQLKTLTIDSFVASTACPQSVHVGILLLNSDLAPSTVESLRLNARYGSNILSHREFHWSRLRSLVLHTPLDWGDDLPEAIDCLEKFHGPTLREVILEMDVRHFPSSPRSIVRNLLLDNPVLKKLEHSLLRFSHPGIMWIILDPLRADSHSFWSRELGRHFPLLYQRGATLALKANSETATPAGHGHDSRLKALIVSPNSKWVASASCDYT
ncbi:hypothetical protein LXA43DRAFT_104173, partial [Ganoderma leucocontextum]